VWKLDRLSRSLRYGAIGRGPEPDRSNRHHHAGRTHDHAEGRSFAQSERAMLRKRTKIGLETSRPRWRRAAKSYSSTAEGDCADDLQREEDGRGRRPLVRRPPSHDLPSAIQVADRRQFKYTKMENKFLEFSLATLGVPTLDA
jgi:hypothetical protein